MNFDDVFGSQHGQSTWRPAAGDSQPTITLNWGKNQRVQALVIHNPGDPANATNSFSVTWSDGSTMTGNLGSGSKAQVVNVDNVKSSSMTFKATSKTGRGGLAEISVIAEADDTNKRNVAAGKTFTYGTGGSTTLPSNDVINSGWPNFADVGTGAQSVTVDLGANYMIDGLRVWRYYADARRYNDVIYEVSKTADFANSTKVFNSNSSGSLGRGTGSDNTFSESSYGHPVYFAAVEGRYVRLWSNGSSANTGNHYVEVQVFGRKNALRGLVPTSAPGGSIGNASLVTDGSINTGWPWAEVSGSYIQFDMGASKTIDALRVRRYYEDARVYKNTVWQISNDPTFPTGASTTVYNSDSLNVHLRGRGRDSTYRESAAGKLVEFAPVTGRYIRLYSQGSNFNTGVHYQEVEAFEVN